MRNLSFQESQAGMNQWNNYLSMMGMGANTAIGLGQGFSGAQMGAIGQMSQGGGWGGALSGAAGGAATAAGVSGCGAARSWARSATRCGAAARGVSRYRASRLACSVSEMARARSRRGDMCAVLCTKTRGALRRHWGE